MARDQDDAYDIYLLRLSGVPIFAGCTGSDYCTEHMNNHELQSAFLSAIYSFSKGISAGNPLRSVVFQTMQINIKVDEPNDLMIAVVHSKEVEPDKIREQIDAAHKLFLEKYKRKMDSSVPLNEEQLFRQFEKDLRDRKIVHKTSVQILKDRLASAFSRKK
jgi:hypothetical protein